MTKKKIEPEELKKEETWEDDIKKWASKKKQRRGGSPFWAILFISLGVVFLLNNFDVLSWDVWASIWRLWPLILVIWGLEIVFGRSSIGKFIVAIIVLALLAYLLFLSSGNTFLPTV